MQSCTLDHPFFFLNLIEQQQQPKADTHHSSWILSLNLSLSLSQTCVVFCLSILIAALEVLVFNHPKTGGEGLISTDSASTLPRPSQFRSKSLSLLYTRREKGQG